MSQLRICLFEKLSVDYGGHETKCFRSQKAQELFCYLLMYRNHIHHRSTLADQLWGEMKIENTKAYLRKALWQLQISLNSVSEHLAEKLLKIESEWLEVDLHSCCWLDIAQFEEAYKQVKGVRGRELDNQQYQALKTAVDLYKGDLLIGWYQDWCIFERERLKEMLIEIINKLMEYCEANGDFDTGISFGDMLLRFDRAHERTHRRLMRIYYFAGYRATALRQFEKCKNALKEELSVDPSKRTYELYDKIRNERDEELSLPKEASKPKLDSNPSILSAINSLGRIKKHLARQASDQKKLFEEVQMLENALKMQD